MLRAAIVTFFSLYIGSVMATEQASCPAKLAALRHQIDQAQHHQQQRQVARLNRAYASEQARCRPPSAFAQRNAMIAAKERAVAEYQSKLERAQAAGQPDKIALQRQKLAVAEQQLKEAQSQLFN